ncbi:hypothetical protein ACIPXV_27250 [Streptomyces libani]
MLAPLTPRAVTGRPGRYSFTASAPVGGALHPLRDPDSVELDEDAEG